MSDLERWRQLFREESQKCVQELREVLREESRGEEGGLQRLEWRNLGDVFVLCGLSRWVLVF